MMKLYLDLDRKRATGLMAWSALVVVSYFVATSVSRSQDINIVAFLALALLVVCLRDEKATVILGLLIAFYWPFITYHLSARGVYANLLFAPIVLLLARRALLSAMDRRFYIRSPLNNPLLGLVAFIVISFLLADNPFGVAVKGAVSHVLPALLCVVVASSQLSEKFIKQIIMAILVIGLLQVAASVLQYHVIYAGTVQGFRQDNSGGLFGRSSGGVNAVFMAYLFSIFVGFMLTQGIKLRYLFGSLLLIVPISLSSARAGLLFLPLTGMITGVIASMIDGKRFLKTLALSLFTVVILIGAVGFLASEFQVQFITDPEAIQKYSMRGERNVGRLQVPAFVHSAIGYDPVTAVFGLGPGSITRTSQVGKNENKFYVANEEVLRNPNSYLYATVELGYGGLLLFLYLHLKVFAYNVRFYRKINDRYWKAMSIGLIGIIATSVYSIFYVNTWIQPSLSFCMWFIAGSIYRVGCLRGIFRPNIRRDVMVPRFAREGVPALARSGT